MERARVNDLQEWLASNNRRPLVLRGARQVGKTWLVRHFTKLEQRKLVEINFEKNPSYKSLFESNDPKIIVREINAELGVNIQASTHLLFLDEIQVYPELLAKLRWFAEEMVELPVIAAGSLLEFVLAAHDFSMPVGRVSYMHLEPLSFEEFLWAHEKTHLIEYLEEYQLTTTISEAVHAQFMQLFKEYMSIGGLPAAVASWVKQASLSQISQIHHELLTTYRDDFAKYRGRLDVRRLEECLLAVPRQLSQKFVYSQVNREDSTKIKQALELLSKAKLCHYVMSTAANGIPLGAEINTKFFKMIFLDVGLVSSLLGIHLNEIKAVSEINLINKGALAEQVAGQLLRTLPACYIEPKLYYWQRIEKGASSEVDYVIQQGDQVIPLEVKAGTSGTLKSLHLLMEQKELPLAVRINSDFPSITEVSHQGKNGSAVKYTLVSLPFYLIGQLPRLLALQKRYIITN